MGYIIWFLLCLSVGWLAQSRGRSFWGFCLLSIILSPLLTGVLVLLFKKHSKNKTEKIIE
jgi:membrane protein DedA with SNARE-associated domain